MKTYIEKTTHKMNLFFEINKHRVYYENFNYDVHYHNSLQELYQLLESIRFQPSIFKITEVGYLLKVFYIVHSTHLSSSTHRRRV